MTSVLGKRKSRTSRADPDVSSEGAAAIFRRHFEAQFAPLEPGVEKPTPSPDGQEDVEDLRSDSESEGGEEDSEDYEGDAKAGHDQDDKDEWDGLSDEELDNHGHHPPTIEVIDTTATILNTSPKSALSRREARAYLSSHVPLPSLNSISSTSQDRAKKGSKSPEEGDEDSAALLRNDLALRRLLSESHLFTQDSSSADGDPTTHQGRTRHLATDLRLSSLGSKSSIYTQVKMPMSHRKGIAAAAAARESKRRKEARENGIILERPTAAGDGNKAKRREGGRRERAVDAPAVGKFRGGMLKLSKQDVREIEGPKDRGGGKRRRR